MKPIAITSALFVVVVGAVVAASLAPRIPILEAERLEIAGHTAQDAVNKYPVAISEPRAKPTVVARRDAATGDEVRVDCATCHATKVPNLDASAGQLPAQFHKGMKFQHGELTCLACHDRGNYDQLHLADGKAVAFSEVMTLCAQCHAKRHADYQHGAHGGRNGYWDQRRGPATRKHCVDCHNPHWPQFPSMRPTFKPRDRFLDADHADQAHEDKTSKSHDGSH